MATPNDVLNIARGEIGYSRWTDPKPGSKYGRWYADLTGDSYYGVSGVPYCAMFVSWVFYHANQSAPGLPGAYCPWIVNAGRKAGATVATKKAQAGDIVLFDWGGDGVSDHVGIVESNNGSYLTTIEGNTSGGNNSNGGAVMRRTRAYSTVICIIRPTYTGDEDMPLSNEDLNAITDVVNNNWKLGQIEGSIGNLSGAVETLSNNIAQVIDKATINVPIATLDGSIYRLVNTSTGAHRWTSSTDERNDLIAHGWSDEGRAFELQAGTPLYGLVNPYNNDCMLTVSADEARSLIGAGWRSYGIIGLVPDNGTAVHRLRNTANDTHMFVASTEETEVLKSSGYADEGVAFYAL